MVFRHLPTDMRPGARHPTVSSGECEIMAYNNSTYVKVIFPETGYTTIANSHDIRKGRIKDRYHPCHLGKGYLGAGPHKTSIYGNHLKQYTMWRHMLTKCYDPSHKSYAAHGGHGVTVCEEWLNYQTFGNWYYKICEQLDVDPDDNLLMMVRKGDVYSEANCILKNATDKRFGKNDIVHHFMYEGEACDIRNLSKYCRDNRLSRSCMYNVQRGRTVQYKGYTKA